MMVGIQMSPCVQYRPYICQLHDHIDNTLACSAHDYEIRISGNALAEIEGRQFAKGQEPVAGVSVECKTPIGFNVATRHHGCEQR